MEGGGVIKLHIIYFLDEKYVNNKISHTTLSKLCISFQKAQFILINFINPFNVHRVYKYLLLLKHSTRKMVPIHFTTITKRYSVVWVWDKLGQEEMNYAKTSVIGRTNERMQDWSPFETLILLKFAYKNNEFGYNVKFTTKKGCAQYIYRQNMF